MKLLILTCLAATCYADLLAPKQQAPQSAYSAGGGDFLTAPRNQYLQPPKTYYPPPNPYPPTQRPSYTYVPPQPTTRPSNTYIPPQPTSRPSYTYIPPQPTTRPSQSYLPPQPITQRPSNAYIPPKPTQKPVISYLPPSKPDNGYLPPNPHGPTTPPVPILKQINELHADGSYRYETLTGDQTHIEQMGHIENLGTDHEEQVMHGSYSYVGDDGKTYTVTYVADANGFRATGDHLPTPPPIPEAIQESLNQRPVEQHYVQGYPDASPSQPWNKPYPASGYY